MNLFAVQGKKKGIVDIVLYSTAYLPTKFV